MVVGTRAAVTHDRYLNDNAMKKFTMFAPFSMGDFMTSRDIYDGDLEQYSPNQSLKNHPTIYLDHVICYDNIDIEWTIRWIPKWTLHWIPG
jgi:hypothetical protein